MEQTEPFKMLVEEVVKTENVHELIVAGSVEAGSCQVNDALLLISKDKQQSVRCVSFELIRWGKDRDHWVSIRISGDESLRSDTPMVLRSANE